MDKLRIFLGRHGQDRDNALGTLSGHRNEPLTQKGIEQAYAIAEKIRMAGLRFDHVYSSPLQRAAATATIIAKVTDAPMPEVMPDLIERDFGVMTGKSKDVLRYLPLSDVLQTDTICYFLNPAGAETFPQLVERGKLVIAWVRARHASGNVLLETHGDIGKMIFAAFYNRPWDEVLRMFHFGNAELLELTEGLDLKDAHVFQVGQHNT